MSRRTYSIQLSREENSNLKILTSKGGDPQQMLEFIISQRLKQVSDKTSRQAQTELLKEQKQALKQKLKEIRMKRKREKGFESEESESEEEEE